MASNRKTVRAALKTLLETALTTCQKVYGYRIGDFGNQSPVAMVSVSGSARERTTFQGHTARMYFQIDVFVMYADGSSWGEDDAEDALDDIEAGIAGVIEANQQTANWAALDLEGRSQRIDVMIGGVEYARESMIVMARVYG